MYDCKNLKSFYSEKVWRSQEKIFFIHACKSCRPSSRLFEILTSEKMLTRIRSLRVTLQATQLVIKPRLLVTNSYPKIRLHGYTTHSNMYGRAGFTNLIICPIL